MTFSSKKTKKEPNRRWNIESTTSNAMISKLINNKSKSVFFNFFLERIKIIKKPAR